MEILLILLILVLIYITFTRNRSKESYTMQYGYYMSPQPPTGCAAGSFPVGSGYDTEVYGGTPPFAGGCACDDNSGCGIGNTGQIQCLPRCKNENDCPDGISCCGATENSKGICSIQCPTIWKIVGSERNAN